MEKVILVNENDEVIGEEEKITAHLEGGKLHRAFSIFVFNAKGEMLLQKRAKAKYHAGGLWSNTCCGHPKPGEDVTDAAKRRPEEEMGFSTDLKKEKPLVYKVEVGGDMTEYEYLHIFTGIYDGSFNLNPQEVEDTKWITLDKLKEDVKINSKEYTPWFILALPKFLG